MKKVVVIGSNSFSGSDFIDLILSKGGYQVIGTSRSPEKDDLFLPYKKNKSLAQYEFHQIDLNKEMASLESLLESEKPQYIINFAALSEVAPSWDHPEQWFNINAVAIASLGNFLRKQNWLERYVHISSPEVYGTCEGGVKEDAPLNPSTPYAASKAAGDLMLFTLRKNFNFPMVMIRATNVYGPCQQLFKIVPRTVIYLKAGKTIRLHGGGKATKSYVHIRDVSQGELAAMEKGENGKIYHFSPEKGIAIRDLVKYMCNLMGKSFEESTENVAERLGQDKAYVIDSTRARQELAWAPKINIDSGLNEVVHWVERNWTTIKKQPLEYIHKP